MGCTFFLGRNNEWSSKTSHKWEGDQSGAGMDGRKPQWWQHCFGGVQHGVSTKLWKEERERKEDRIGKSFIKLAFINITI